MSRPSQPTSKAVPSTNTLASASSPGSGSLATTTASETGTASTSSHVEGDETPQIRHNSRQRTGSIQSEAFAGPGILDYAGGEEPEEEGNPLRNESSSVIKFYPDWCHCCSCLRRSDAPQEPVHGWAQSLRNAFLCPPQGPLARTLTFILVIVFGWLFTWALLLEVESRPMRSPAAPLGPVFALVVLLILGLFAGITMKLFRLPSLLGPLVLGIVLRNIHPLNIFVCFQSWHSRDCDSAKILHAYFDGKKEECRQAGIETSGHWIKPIRQIALTMILTRAGLELSPKQLKKLKGIVPSLAFLPCIVEACVCACVTYLLFNVAGDFDADGNKLTGDSLISLPMCFTAGFALAAVSPAVVVPGMLSLKRKLLGVGQGIPTLLIAASSIDDVLAISMYTICMGIALAGSDPHHSAWMTYSAGPISILVGITHGFVVGLVLHFLPARGGQNKAAMRLALLLTFNFCAMFGYETVELVSGAGSLAVLVTAFIASFGWRSQPHWKPPMKKIEHSLALLWTLCVPLLFGTIGREIDFHEFVGLRVAKILAIIFICLVFRCLTAFFVVGFAKINFREQLFCALAWIPKATVQAALAPLVVSKIQSLGHDADKLKPHGEIVVTLAVLAILLTAPLGSVLIAFFGPRLLRTATIPEQITLAEEFPNGDGPEVKSLVKIPGGVGTVSLDSMQTPGGGNNRGQLRRSSSAEAVMEKLPTFFGSYRKTK